LKGIDLVHLPTNWIDQSPMNSNPPDSSRESPWLLPAEAAAYLRIALGTLRNWTAQRFVPFAKRGRTVRYHRATLHRWLTAGGAPPDDARQADAAP